MSKRQRFVVATYCDGNPTRMAVRDGRPLAIKELERIGMFRDSDRAVVREFLEERRDMVPAVVSDNWTNWGWVMPLAED